MMFKRGQNVSFIFFTLLLLVLSGCSGRSAIDISSPWQGGNEGLVMSMLEGAPPEAVFDANQFPFIMDVRVKNVGESSVGVFTDGYQDPYVVSDRLPNRFAELRIVGLLPGTWGNPQILKNFEFENVGLRSTKKTLDGSLIEGGERDFIFDGFNYQPDLSGNTVVPFRVELCYDYSTHAIGQICLKNDILELKKDDSLCQLNQDIVPYNSGAPVQVTSMKQIPLGPNAIQLSFVVSHVGNGEVFARDDLTYFPQYKSTSPLGNSYVSCDSNAHQNRNRVYIDAHFKDETLSGGTISCSTFQGGHAGVVTLVNEASVPVFCEVRFPDVGTRVFSDIVSVDMYYRYLTYIDRQILIQDLSVTQ